MPDQTDSETNKKRMRIGLRAGGVTTFLIALGVALAAYAVRDKGELYMFSFMAGVPFVVGIFSGAAYGGRSKLAWLLAEAMALATLTLVAVFLISSGVDGLICIAMALPLVLPIATVGVFIGLYVQKRAFRILPPAAAGLILFAMPPLALQVESTLAPKPPVYAVTTRIVINAPPETIWKNVVTFPPLPPPTEWVFRLGIAYPKHATIEGEGPGAIRRCVFDTGDFVEPIEEWRPPTLLKFAVTANPPPMHEWSPYDSIQPAHLDGFLQARAGQFRLEPLPSGQTLLEGTTWYSHGLRPAAYWRLWSDFIIHQIHGRVLEHIKRLSETPTAP